MIFHLCSQIGNCWAEGGGRRGGVGGGRDWTGLKGVIRNTEAGRERVMLQIQLPMFDDKERENVKKKRDSFT